MYTYDTFEELVVLLDKHFKNTDRFRFNYHVKDHKFHYTITIDGNVVLENSLTIEDPSIFTLDLPEESRDWFRDQWYDFRRNDIPLPPETGKDITVSRHVVVTDPCYNTNDIDNNGQLTSVKPGVYRTKATYANKNGWGGRCTSLILWHENVAEPTTYEHTDITVDVDSGQAGVIDFPYFRELEADENNKERWYDNIQTHNYVRKPVDESLLPIIAKAEELHTQVQTTFSAYIKAKKNVNLPLADLLFDEWLKADRKLSKRLREHGLDTQSLDDHKTAPTFVHALWTDKHAAVTSSGFGDGSYDCFIAKDNNQIVGIKLDYFYDDKEESED